MQREKLSSLGLRRNSPRRRVGTPLFRAGFTLVEMLVAVTIVLLIMVMFAEIFQLAAGAMSTQRGIAENDQRARALTTTLKADLDKRTFRWMAPFFPGEDTSEPLADIDRRQGYFYYSENDPNDDTDDVLQFTVRATITHLNPDATDYYGRATALPIGTTNITANPNQPETDDGIPSPDSTGASPVAEVAYFLRNGNLYRRILLVRDPLPLKGSDTQPTNNNGENYFDPATSNSYPYGRSFWNDFDYSARFSATGAEFNGLETLNNGSDNPSVFAFGKPWTRFGFNHATSNGSTQGRPREYAGGTFIGRFTHQETSDSRFLYPQIQDPPTDNPMDAGTTLTVTDGVVNEFNAGPRRGDDLLLANVHAFDVKIWDEPLGKFVDLGHDETGGDFNKAERDLHTGSISYGPRSSQDNNRVFDTWHPNLDINNDGTDDPPPYRPMVAYPGTTPQWAPGTPYNVGDPVFSTNALGQDYSIVYECIVGGNSDPDPANEPFPDPPDEGLPGQIFVESTGVTWRAVHNRRAVKAIQITARIYDPSSDQMRQVTIIHSFVR